MNDERGILLWVDMEKPLFCLDCWWYINFTRSPSCQFEFWLVGLEWMQDSVRVLALLEGVPYFQFLRGSMEGSKFTWYMDQMRGSFHWTYMGLTSHANMDCPSSVMSMGVLWYGVLKGMGGMMVTEATALHKLVSEEDVEHEWKLSCCAFPEVHGHTASWQFLAV